MTRSRIRDSGFATGTPEILHPTSVYTHFFVSNNLTLQRRDPPEKFRRYSDFWGSLVNESQRLILLQLFGEALWCSQLAVKQMKMASVIHAHP